MAGKAETCGGRYKSTWHSDYDDDDDDDHDDDDRDIQRKTNLVLGYCSLDRYMGKSGEADSWIRFR